MKNEARSVTCALINCLIAFSDQWEREKVTSFTPPHPHSHFFRTAYNLQYAVTVYIYFAESIFCGGICGRGTIRICIIVVSSTMIIIIHRIAMNWNETNWPTGAPIFVQHLKNRDFWINFQWIKKSHHEKFEIIRPHPFSSWAAWVMQTSNAGIPQPTTKYVNFANSHSTSKFVNCA